MDDLKNYANDDIVISEIAEMTDKDFEEIENADWDLIYNSLEQEEQRLLDELETINQKTRMSTPMSKFLTWQTNAKTL